VRISDSEAFVKEEKSGGVVGEVGEYVDDVLGLPERDRRRLDILSVKKEAKLSAREILGVEYVTVKRIYGVRVCLWFTRGAWGRQRMTRQG